MEYIFIISIINYIIVNHMNINTKYRNVTTYDFTTNTSNFVMCKYDIKMYQLCLANNINIDINQFYYLKYNSDFVSINGTNNLLQLNKNLTLDSILICAIDNNIYAYNLYYKQYYTIQINNSSSSKYISNYDKIPIYNQYNLNSCTAFALSYLFSYYILMEKPFEDIIQIFNGSELNLFYHERLIMERRYKIEYTDFNYGVYIDCAINALELYGMCFEKLNEYDNSFTTFDKKPDKTIKYYKVDRNHTKKLCVSLDNFKKAIDNNIPIIFGMPWYDTFNNLTTISLPFIGNTKGNHAIVCIGYDDINKNLIIRNSWGINWGLNGYFLLSYDCFNTNVISHPWCITSINLIDIGISEDTTSEIDKIQLGNQIYVNITININNVIYYLVRNIDNSISFTKTLPTDDKHIWQIEDQIDLRRIIKVPYNDFFIKFIDDNIYVSAGYSNFDINGNLIDNYLSIINTHPITNIKIPNNFYLSGPIINDYKYSVDLKYDNDIYTIVKSTNLNNIVDITILPTNYK